MPSLFDKKTADEFTQRIQQLSPQTPAKWGKMNVAQMLAHCQVALQMASGDINPKGNALIRFLFSRMAKKQLMSDKAFKPELPTLAEAKIVDQRDFENEKLKLLQLVNAFQALGATGIKGAEHPFFGKMSVSEWDHFQVKHLNHHLNQFGV